MYALVVAVAACTGDNATPQLCMGAQQFMTLLAVSQLKFDAGATLMLHLSIALMKLEFLLNASKQCLQGAPLTTVLGLR